MNRCLLWRTRTAHDVKGEIPADIFGKSRRIANGIHQPVLVSEHLLLCVGSDIVRRRDVLGDGQELRKEHGGLCLQPHLWRVAHSAQRIGGVVRLSGRDGQTVERLLRQHRGGEVERDRDVKEVQCVALHNESICMASCLLIGMAEDRPDRRLGGTHPKGALPAGDGILRIPIGKEILRREDIGVRRIPTRLAVRGELREKVVIVGVLLRPREEIVKEPLRIFIVVPERRELVWHTYPFRGSHAQKSSPLFAISRIKSRARG